MVGMILFSFGLGRWVTCKQERGRWCHRWGGGQHANERGDGGVTDGRVDDVQMTGDSGRGVTDGHCVNKKGRVWCNRWVGIMRKRENGRITDGQHVNERGQWCHRWVMCNERGQWPWCHRWAMYK